MPRYYFHAVNNRELLRDEEGEELPDDEGARNTAIRAARELLAEGLKYERATRFEAFVIEDEHGHYTVLPMAEAIPRSLRG